MPQDLSRRDILRLAAGAGALALTGCGTSPRDQSAAKVVGPRKHTLRIAHLNDIHMQPERDAPGGMTACLAHIMAQPKRPDMVITGGDLIMDGFAQPYERTSLQWDLWQRIFADQCSLPVLHTLGNHDIWGWNKDKSATTGAESRWGKNWALEALRLQRSYYAVDRAGWRIIILDSVQPNADRYIGRIDDEQFAWLDQELTSAGPRANVLVVSHIPILGMAPVEHDARIEESDWRIPGAVMHIDGRKLHRLFVERGNVRLCLSGHIHKLDRVDYAGITYICDGAVSGAWWRGPENRCPEGYGLVDLYSDGSFEHRYHTYGWQAREA